MEYTIENEYLRVTVTTWGAQVKSVIRKSDGVEHMWQADPAVWGYHAPILFPHAGKVSQDTIHAKGKDYPSGQHGFARLMEHDFVEQTGTALVLELCSSEETLAKFPYEFRLVSTFELENDTLHHSLTVENLDDTDLPFGIGYHPAFTIPFDSEHSYEDYELRFSETESPICLDCQPGGLVQGTVSMPLGSNISRVQVDEELFAHDSHCMVNLKSEKLGLYEKGTGRGVVCNISEFPYTLIWSKPGRPRFVCIEPWHNVPAVKGSSTDWNEKPAAAILAPGEVWSTTLSTSFVR